MPKSNPHRLSAQVVPQRYTLTIKPDLNDFTFTGRERIALRVLKKTKTLVLHSLDLQIHSAQIHDRNGSSPALRISYQKKAQTVSLTFAKAVVGNLKLDLEFTGIINQKLKGFYRSSYEHNGERRHLATTQFEATDARRAFPCFDEPAHKAIFDVTLMVPHHLSAISNTKETAITAHDEHYKVVKFAPTPKMSTYLLAFIVGEFESVETSTKTGTLVRVFTTPGKIQQARFALETAKRALEFLNDYFDIPYALPVLDLIAIPDFSAGAMENWGAVTFRETALLVDEEHTPFVNRQRVAEVIAHELVHQWFGNLVTMEWWTHLWLNESFADYMAYLTVDHLFPEWHFWTKFVLWEHSSGLLLDSLEATHPVEVEVHHPDQIGQIFDAISYSKGASLLRMLCAYIGPDNFRDGLRWYLKKHSFRNTSSVHLWEAFEKVSGKPVGKLMKKWTTLPGYPLISAELSKGDLTLKQQRFTLSGKAPASTTWEIPVQAQLSQDRTSDQLFLKQPTGRFPLPRNFRFLKINPAETAFHRTIYSPELLALLLPAVQTGKLSTVDELGLIRDLFQACRAGYIGTDVYLEALGYYRTNQSYVVWTQIAEDFHTLHRLYAGNSVADRLAQIGQELFEPLVRKYGWRAKGHETTTTTLLRSLAIRNAGRYGSAVVRQKAQRLFEMHLKGQKLDPNLRAAVYGATAEVAKAPLVRQMIALYREEPMTEEKNRLAYALMAVTAPSALKPVTQFIFSDDIRSQDRSPIIYFGLENPVLRSSLWPLVKQNWNQLAKEATGSLLSRIISAVGHFNTRKEQTDALAFLKATKHPGIVQAIKQSREQIGISQAWLKREEGKLRTYFRRSKS